jgi:acyl-CoA thioester hydrolase
MSASKIKATIEFDIEFCDVDSMQIVWHGNYIKYFEKARCALLNKLSYNYIQMKESGYAFPIVKIEAKYIAPLTFGDRVKAVAILEEYENTIQIKYELYNAKTGILTTKGSSAQMAYCIASRDTEFICPAFFIERVEALLKADRDETD